MDPTAEAHEFLLRSLEAGQTGCITTTVTGGARIEVYVMLGEVLAAHAEDDGDQMLRRLYNARSITMSQMASARQRLAAGEALSDVLSATVGETALMDMFHQRFRENVFRFLTTSSGPSFEPLDSVMVENIQVGHDSRELVADLMRLGRDLAPWLAEPDATLSPGDGTHAPTDDVTIFALCTPSRRVQEVLQASPFEPTRTLLILRDFVRRGVLRVQGGALGGGGTRRETTLAERLAALRNPPRPPERSFPPTPAERGYSGTSPERPAEPVAARPPVRPVEAPPRAPVRPAPVVDMAPTRPVLPPDEEMDAEDTVDDVIPTDAAAGRNTLRRAVRQAFDRVVRPETPPVTPVPAPVPLAPSPPPPDPAGDYIEVTEELDLFADHDRSRGDGAFTTERQLLDVVDLTGADGEFRTPPVAALPKYEGPIEMADAESAGIDALQGAVTLNFAGPKLQEDEAARKVDVTNEVLAEVAQALDGAHGLGMGRARVQLLVEGTPGAFAPLFKHVEVDEAGCLPAATVLKNLRKRPVSEHRRLLNRGLGDLIERSLSLADESLDENQLEHLLERIAGYQQRFGV